MNDMVSKTARKIEDITYVNLIPRKVKFISDVTFVEWEPASNHQVPEGVEYSEYKDEYEYTGFVPIGFPCRIITHEGNINIPPKRKNTIYIVDWEILKMLAVLRIDRDDCIAPDTEQADAGTTDDVIRVKGFRILRPGYIYGF